MRGKDMEGALGAFEKVLRSSPLNPHALTGKGMALHFMGRNDEAAIAYQQAIQVKQDHVPALNNLAMLWADKENTRLQAVNLAMAAFVRSNSDPAVIDTLGYALIRSGRSAEAVKILERATELAPQNPAILYHYALAHAEAGNAKEALAALEAALAMGDFEARPEAERLLQRLQKG
jgi:Flp pilus assembly protein TadD